jgi:peptide/nickel transport system permease protein
VNAASSPADADRPERRPATIAAFEVGTRLLLALLTVALVSVLVFALVEVLPQDVAVVALGRESTEEQREAFRAELDLDDPAVTRYVRWASGVAQGDFGDSIISRQPISEQLMPRLKYTAILALISLVAGVSLAFLLAVSLARRSRRALRSVASSGALALSAVPEYVIGILLLALLASHFQVFPVVSGGVVNGDLKAYVLPALTLALVVASYVYRIAQVALTEASSSNYVRTAVLNGFSARYILWRQVVPVASVVVVNVIAINAIYLIGGVIVVENVFSYPGLGTYLVSAVQTKDLPAIEGVAVVLSALLIAINLLADVSVVALDPRLRSRA